MIRWGWVVVAIVVSCDAGGSGSGGKRRDALEVEWIRPGCDGPFLQISVEASPEQTVRALGTDFYRNDQGRAFYNFKVAAVGDAPTVSVEVGGVAKEVEVPAKPIFPYGVTTAMLDGAAVGHWKGTIKFGADSWQTKADTTASGAVRFPLPCGATGARPVGDAPKGSFEELEGQPYFAAELGEQLSGGSTLDEQDVRFDLDLEGYGGPGKLEIAGKLSVADVVGSTYAGSIEKGITWAPQRAAGATPAILLVLDGHAETELLHGAAAKDATVVAIGTSTQVAVESCRYQQVAGYQSGEVTRTRADSQFVLYEAKTGKKLGKKMIKGVKPDCPEHITRSEYQGSTGTLETQDVEQLTGEPNHPAARKWAERAAR